MYHHVISEKLEEAVEDKLSSGILPALPQRFQPIRTAAEESHMALGLIILISVLYSSSWKRE